MLLHYSASSSLFCFTNKSSKSSWVHVCWCCLCVCVSQGAGAATCAWLCSRTKPPYTSRTRTLLPSDWVGLAPSVTGSPPPKEGNVRPVSSALQAPSRCSWVTSQISSNSLNLYSVSGGLKPSLPTYLQSFHQTHTHWSYIRCRNTLSGLCLRESSQEKPG